MSPFQWRPLVPVRFRHVCHLALIRSGRVLPGRTGRMTLNQLRAFVEAERLGSFTALIASESGG